MRRRVVPALLVAVAAAAVASPAMAATTTTTTAPTFSLIGDVAVPQFTFLDTFGGISGVDYDAAHNTWRAISNDGSNHGSARFYELNLSFSTSATGPHLDSASRTFGRTVTLLRADGTPYPPSATAGQDTVEPEAIRYDPTTNNVFWANEGVNNANLVVGPSVRQSTTDGAFVAQLPPASQVANGTATTGIRDGAGLTGLTFSANGAVAFSTVGGPLLQDGPNPTATTGAFTRILGASRTLGFRNLAEFAYPLDKLPLTDANGNGTNQVEDILTVDATHYLVLETGTAPGRGYSARLYEIDTSVARNIVNVPSLNGATFTPVAKTLLLDFSSLNLPEGVPNLSGLTWGPTLSNGHRSLVFVSDNGFDGYTPTHLIGLDVAGL